MPPAGAHGTHAGLRLGGLNLNMLRLDLGARCRSGWTPAERLVKTGIVDNSVDGRGCELYDKPGVDEAVVSSRTDRIPDLRAGSRVLATYSVMARSLIVIHVDL